MRATSPGHRDSRLLYILAGPITQCLMLVPILLRLTGRGRLVAAEVARPAPPGGALRALTGLA